jgi:hypothetical protein
MDVRRGDQFLNLIAIQEFRDRAPLFRTGKMFGGIGVNQAFGQQKVEKITNRAEVACNGSTA